MRFFPHFRLPVSSHRLLGGLLTLTTLASVATLVTTELRADDPAPTTETTTAADPTKTYAAQTFDFKKDEGGLTLPYRLFSPKVEEGKTYPLIVFLHGAGERGDDNVSQLKHGAPDLASLAQEGHPAFVLVPQCPSSRRWAEADWSGKAEAGKPAAEDATDPAAAVLALVEKLSAEHPIDPNRLYLTGLSLGGYGTWDIIARQPTLFAAAVPICGGSRPELAERMKGVPLWVFHGDADPAVPVSRSREMVEALKKLDAKVKYTEYPGVGHDSWTASYHNPKLYSWLFERVKKTD